MIFNVNSGAGKIPINVVPNTNSSFTYDGTVKTPVWQNYDSEQLTISGADSATNAGTYKVYFTPKADYEWSDGTTTPREASWSISKAAGSLSLSAGSGTLIGKRNNSTTFTVTRAGDGAIAVSSSNTGVATVSLSGATVTVKAAAYGSATITVSVAAGTNHTAPGSKTYTINVNSQYVLSGSNQYASFTGGWKAVNGAITGTINSSGISFTGSGDTKRDSTLYTKNKIDVSKFDKLLVSKVAITGTLSSSGGQQIVVGLTTNNTSLSPNSDGTWVTAAWLTGLQTHTNVSVDMPSSGSYYIAVYSNCAIGTVNGIQLS